MLRYRLRLVGPEATGARISATVLRTMLDVLSEGARGALRLRVEGRSSARGTPPGWLVRACEFHVTGLRSGSTILDLEAPTLEEAAPEEFAQVDFVMDLGRGQTCLGLVRASLAEALDGKEDSELFDDALLGRFEELDEVFRPGLEALELVNSAPGGDRLTIDSLRIANVRRMRRQTPPSQRVRVAGLLDSIRHSDRMFTLKLESGLSLKGIAEGVEPEHLAQLWGKRAVLSATAVFRPSGRVLRLEADHIEPAREDFAFWSQEPRPLWGAPDPALRQPQGPRSGINAIIGQWPGDETDEQVAKAVAALS